MIVEVGISLTLIRSSATAARRRRARLGLLLLAGISRAFAFPAE
jgi:hypothetical protein